LRARVGEVDDEPFETGRLDGRNLAPSRLRRRRWVAGISTSFSQPIHRFAIRAGQRRTFLNPPRVKPLALFGCRELHLRAEEPRANGVPMALQETGRFWSGAGGEPGPAGDPPPGFGRGMGPITEWRRGEWAAAVGRDEGVGGGATEVEGI